MWQPIQLLVEYPRSLSRKENSIRMKVLIICSKNSGRVVPFITEQAQALVDLGLSVNYFYIENKGLKGYLTCYRPFLRIVKDFQPDIIHAHYGLSGVLANMQRIIPVVTTYHGSDVNIPKVLFLSRIAMALSKWNIFVSEQQLKIAGMKSSCSIIPCGVDLELFKPINKAEARKKLQLDVDKKYVLFAGAFNNAVKNAALAQEAISMIPTVTLIELKGYTREQVVLLMTAVDAVLMTSHSEGSPQFIKEAMACNCPIISVEVGDVPQLIEGVGGCYSTSYQPTEIAEKLQHILVADIRTNGRERIMTLGLDVITVAKRIVAIYQSIYN